jgi:hypothetical protein
MNLRLAQNGGKLLSSCTTDGLSRRTQLRGVSSGIYIKLQLRHYATNRKVAASIPDEVIFSIYLILPAALGPGVYSASNRNEYRKYINNNVSGE